MIGILAMAAATFIFIYCTTWLITPLLPENN